MLPGLNEVPFRKADRAQNTDCCGFACALLSQKLSMDLEELCAVLQALSQHEGFGNSTRLGDVYWNVMMLLGFT